MLDSQTFIPQMAEKALMLNRGQRVISDKPEPAQIQSENALNWFRIEETDGGLKLAAIPNTTQVDVTSVSIYADEVSAPRTLSLFGCKIDFNEKIEGFKENYIKNYTLTKSHNLMVARFAELKTAFYAYLLSLAGCTSEDIRKLQKKAIEGSIKQNKMLFEENEYNGELLTIVGGGGKRQIRAQQRVIGEIRNQLAIQMKNLGLGDCYATRRIIEIQIEQCQKILNKFQEEKASLEYQLAYFGAN